MTSSPALVALFAAAALAVSAWAVLLYRRRELPVRGRGWLAALRVAALLLLLLLLLDPSLPSSVAGPSSRDRVLLDGSLSMGASSGVARDRSGGASEATPWGRALAAARASGGEVTVFGGPAPYRLDPDRPGADTVTLAPGSRLTPALERAAEAGSRRVTVITDLRLADAREAAATAERLGLAVDVVDVGGDAPGAAVASITVPEALERDEAVPVEVTVTRTGVRPAGDSLRIDADAAPADSATVEVREDERLVASRRVALPGPGRLARLELSLPAPQASGVVRYEARVVSDGDAWSDDDARAAWSEVDPEEGALVLVASAPDWEPRFLLPVLGQVTGLRTRGLVRAGEDRWLVMDEGGAATFVDDARAEREARGAAVLVVQGGGREGAPWLAGTVEGARRVLVLARSPADAALAGVRTGGAVPGEWYAAPDVPASPVAGDLAGVELEGLPPLGPVLPLRTPAGGGEGADDAPAEAVALRVRRGPGAAPEAALVLRSGSGGRSAVALAPGWWRWAFRPDDGREPYRRLWAGVAGWLLAGSGTPGPAVRPVTPLVARGAPVTWAVAGAGSEAGAAPPTVALTVSATGAGGDTVVVDTVVPVPPSGRVSTPPLPPGRYAWRARLGDGEEASGPLEVERWTAEMIHPRATELADRAGEAREGVAPSSRPGRPVRTHPLPWVLLLALLSAEWIGRRRRGLR